VQRVTRYCGKGVAQLYAEQQNGCEEPLTMKIAAGALGVLLAPIAGATGAAPVREPGMGMVTAALQPIKRRSGDSRVVQRQCWIVRISFISDEPIEA